MVEQLYDDQYVNVGGINTRFWTAGDKGKVIVLIHGAFSSVDWWSANMPALAENHRVYALDMPGFGLTDKIPLKSLSHAAHFINDFMKTQNIEEANLIGHSMGGGCILEYVYLYPDKVSSLVLIDSLGLGREVHFLFKLLSIPVIGELILRPSRSGSKKSLGVAVYDQSLVTDELVDMAYRLACIPGTAKCLLSFIRTGSSIFGIDKEFIRPIIEKLPTVEAPTLIIWGEQDRLFPVEHASVALKNIPDAQLEVFERCGHIPHLEHPDKFNSLVLKFLEK